MTLEQIKDDVEKIIDNLSRLIAQEEQSSVKTANLPIYKEKLAVAEILKSDVENDIGIRFDFGAELREMQLNELKMAIA